MAIAYGGKHQPRGFVLLGVKISRSSRSGHVRACKSASRLNSTLRHDGRAQGVYGFLGNLGVTSHRHAAFSRHSQTSPAISKGNGVLDFCEGRVKFAELFADPLD